MSKCQDSLLAALALLGTEFAISFLSAYFQSKELEQRCCQLKKLVDSIECLERLVFPEPITDSIHLSKVVRDGKVFFTPTNLLVEGDLVLASSPQSTGIKSMKLGESSLWSADADEKPMRVLETPASKQIDTAFQHAQQRSIVVQPFRSIRLFFMIALLVIFRGQNMLPILCATSPVFDFIIFLYANTRVHVLSDLLCASSTPYESSDVDEFDEEAPPPTKNIYIQPLLLMRKTIKALKGRLKDSFFWSVDLSFVLARVSVLIFSNREGLLTLPYALPEELYIPRQAAQDLDSIEFVVDLSNPTYFSLAYADSDIKSDDLKALGLAMLLSSSCGVHKHGNFRRDWHRRYSLDESLVMKPDLNATLQTCSCPLARQVGFMASVASNYERIARFHVLDSVQCHIYSGAEMQMISCGKVESILCLCKYFWNTKEIVVLDHLTRRKILDIVSGLEAYDNICVAYSYKPVLSSFQEVSLLLEDNKTLVLANNQIFLGFASSSFQARDDVQEFVDDLDSAGIRFVYFSSTNEQCTKAFGDRLGLETDWNSCISFSSPPSNFHELADGKAKLPKGVWNVRPHLRSVDDIPLHISLFSDCDPASMTEMIKIYKEYDETVLVVGSTLNYQNYFLFKEAHISIGMEPSHDSLKKSALHLSAALTCLDCALGLPFATSPYVFTELIREARTLHKSSVCGCTLWLNSLMIAISTMNFSWMFLAIIFLLFLSYFQTPYEETIMKSMPLKPLSRKDLILYCASHAISTGLICMFVYFLKCCKWTTLILVVLRSASCMYSAHSVITHPPFKNYLWLFLSTITTIFSLMMIRKRDAALVLLPVVGLVIPELLKQLWRKRAALAAKRAKLQFNTRLGMHSPI